MLKVIKYPEKKNWQKLTQRPIINQTDLSKQAKLIFNDIRSFGDQAVRKFTRMYDKAQMQSFVVSKQELSVSEKQLAPGLKNAIRLAKNNIEKFHRLQKEKIKIIETTKGVFCWRESRAIEKIGIYIPGGTAPLFSTVLMLAIPARLAGCKEIIICTPPDKNGKINPVILYAAKIAGIKSIFKVGGMQAIAAMTYGTKSIPKVDKILGPGNQYVTAAKQYAQNFGVAIDMPAGPSEVLVIANKTSNPEFIAADLLSQAEHGIDSQVILVSDNEKLIADTKNYIIQQLKKLPRKIIANQALNNSKAILLKNINECIEFSNQYAPEHLILSTDNAKQLIKLIENAGSVFLGKYSCESAGDYASGTNHTLPTNGFARNYSGVSLDSFYKKITFQQLTKKGIQLLGPSVELMAEAENLRAHKNAVTVRLKNIK